MLTTGSARAPVGDSGTVLFRAQEEPVQEVPMRPTIRGPYTDPKRGRVSRYLVISQLGFFAFLAICLALVPRSLVDHNEGGVSNFGVTAATRIPYTLAFLTGALFILMAGHATPRITPTRNSFRRGLFTLGALFLAVLASTYPYKVDVTFKDAHIVIATLLIAFELAMSMWLVYETPRHWIPILLLVVQATGCLLALITLIGILHLLLVAQLLAGAAFGVLLVRSGRQLVQCGGGTEVSGDGGLT
jgi:hypothetical protein